MWVRVRSWLSRRFLACEEIQGKATFPESGDRCWISSPDFGREMAAPGLFCIATPIIAVVLRFRLVNARWDQGPWKHCANTIPCVASTERKWHSRLGATFTNWEGIKLIYRSSTGEFWPRSPLESSESWSGVVKATYCWRSSLDQKVSSAHPTYGLSLWWCKSTPELSSLIRALSSPPCRAGRDRSLFACHYFLVCASDNFINQYWN